MNILTPSKYDLWQAKARFVDIYTDGRYLMPLLSSRTVEGIRDWVRLLYPEVTQIVIVEE